jgi:ABC-type multidrug transport system ATPase subunit
LRQDISHAGEIRFDGAHFKKDMRQLIGNVEQDDLVIPELTVRETLCFIAELRYGIGSKQALSKVDAVLALMRLEKVAGTRVGDAQTSPRISGGERKRLCIARELLSEPKLLICDEPTSGLDSTMANQVVAAIRELCDSGDVSFISSIHQPSTNILLTFDDLILLREGVVIYFGPVASVEACFTSCGPQRSPSQSTAEYLMDCLVLPPHDPKGMSDESLSVLKRFMQKQDAQFMQFSDPPAVFSVQQEFSAPFSRQLRMLLRLHYILQRGSVLNKLCAVQNLSLMTCAALLWMNLGFSDLDIHPRFGLVMWTLGTWMFFPLFGCLGTFQTNRSVLEKELKKGFYSVEAFFLVRGFLLLPLSFIWPIFWTAGVFWISNVHPQVGVYVLFQLVVFLSLGVFEGAGQAISAGNFNPAHASTFAMILINFWFGWSGFLIDLARIPASIRWLTHGNVFMYSVNLGMHVIFTDDISFTCSKPWGGTSSAECQSGQDTFLGKQALVTQGITRSVRLCLCVLIASFFGVRILAYALLRFDMRHILHGAGAAEHFSEKHQNMQLEHIALAPSDLESASPVWGCTLAKQDENGKASTLVSI